MMFFFKLLILISPTPASALSKHYPGLLAEPELEKMLVKVYMYMDVMSIYCTPCPFSLTS
jgi:hypothetical protein